MTTASQGPTAVIVNPHAKKWTPALADRLAAVNPDTSIHVTDSLDDIPEVARAIREAGVGMLAICGGDGTYHKVLSEVIPLYENETLPLILPLRGGTFNALARHVTPWGDADKILGRALELWERARADGEVPRVRFLPILKVTNHTAGIVQYGFLFAQGLIARFVGRYAEGPKSPARGARVVSEAFGTFVLGGEPELFRMYDGRVTVDDETLPFDRFLSVLCGTLENTILGMSPFAKRFPSRRSFKYLLSAMEVGELFGITPSLFRGKKWNQDPRLPNGLAQSVRLQSDETFMIDGEVWPEAEARDLEVTLGPLLRIPRLPGVWSRVRHGSGASGAGKLLPGAPEGEDD